MQHPTVQSPQVLRRSVGAGGTSPT